MGHQRVAEIWRAFGLKPWEQDEFKVSPDPLLVDKIRDIVGLYLTPPVAAAAFCVDEKPQIQALNRTAPTLPMLPTTPALNTATGEVITDLRQTHTSEDFVAFLNQINRNVADEIDIHLILDNLSAEPGQPQTYSSWMNLVERWFSALTTKNLQRGAHNSVAELAADINTWNTNPTPYSRSRHYPLCGVPWRNGVRESRESSAPPHRDRRRASVLAC
ncbi:MAG: hypothetical protein GY750_15370 [Lentisphaerae bacterium]|nr:hypothetical protein [Lentisphaerota bacterium]